MKIVKHGEKEKQKPYHQFYCDKCGCTFQCEEDEYWQKPQVTYTGVTSATYSCVKKFMTCCPECHKIVEDNEYDQSITASYYNKPYTPATAKGFNVVDTDGDDFLKSTVQIKCKE